MKEMQELLDTMRALRDPEHGCPWDQVQTIESILPHTLEEIYELAEAIETGDMQGLLDELGDLQFHIVFYAQLAGEAGRFTFPDIPAHVNRKLIRRHPHVFSGADTPSAGSEHSSWEAIKREERRQLTGAAMDSILDGISRSIPALQRARKIQKRAATVGFDWADSAPVLDKIEEEIAELRQACAVGLGHEEVLDELGDLLFACVNFARLAGIDPEIALRRSNSKFERRFRYIEQRLAADGRAPHQAPLEEMEALWQEAKRGESIQDPDTDH